MFKEVIKISLVLDSPGNKNIPGAFQHDAWSKQPRLVFPVFQYTLYTLACILSRIQNHRIFIALDRFCLMVSLANPDAVLLSVCIGDNFGTETVDRQTDNVGMGNS